VQVPAFVGDVGEMDAIMTELFDKGQEEMGRLFADIDETRDVEEENVELVVEWIKIEMEKLNDLMAAFDQVNDPRETRV